MANKYLDLTGLQDFATKLATKLHTIFATKADVGAPLVASTVADMTDHDRIYVYTGSETGYTNGNWYYWDGTAWTSGGTYNSQAIGDGTITTAKLASGAVTAEKIADGAVVNSVNGETGAITGVAMDDGYYENMTVGSADQLISSVNIEDKVPYVFRTSGGSADIGDREFDEIHGGTIAWNQLRADTDATLSRDGITTAYDSSTHKISIKNDSRTTNYSQGSDQITLVNAVTVGHKYLVDSDKNEAGVGIVVLNVNSQVLTFVPVNSIFTFSNTATRMSLRVSKDYDFVTAHPVNDVFSFYLNIYDLTQMFGSAIADYIYSLEQANAGAGVAWFKSLFPKPYYAYNAGQLISVSGLSAHKMIGFNQWDEEWEQGGISGDGVPVSATERIRSKNFCQILPNTTYYATCGKTDGGNQNRYYIAVVFYDADKNFISIAWANNLTFTTPSNACYFKLTTNSSTVVYGGTYNNDICINLHWDGERDGEYEPYEVHEYALDSDVTLRGIPKLDADNKLYFDGDVYASDGTVERRYGIVDLGTLTWQTIGASGHKFTTSAISFIKPYPNNAKANMLCSIFTTLPYYTGSSGDADTTIGSIGLKDNNYIFVNSDKYQDMTGAQFKSAVSGVYLVYELATPTTESAEPYTNPQIVDDWGTEEYVIAEQSGVKMPVGHDTDYKPNLRAKLEMSPDSPSGGDGDYIVRQTSGTNEYVKLVIPTELPTNPSNDGEFTLKCTVSGGTATLSWEVQS